MILYSNLEELMINIEVNRKKTEERINNRNGNEQQIEEGQRRCNCKKT